LALVAERWTASTRSRGSVTWSGSRQNIAAMWLPEPSSPSCCSAAGMAATSGRSGTPSRRLRWSRSTPAHTASTTSFTVTPSGRRTRLTSSSDTVAKAAVRRAVRAPLMDSRGPL
jgi:hypothetical protein